MRNNRRGTCVLSFFFLSFRIVDQMIMFIRNNAIRICIIKMKLFVVLQTIKFAKISRKIRQRNNVWYGNTREEYPICIFFQLFEIFNVNNNTIKHYDSIKTIFSAQFYLKKLFPFNESFSLIELLKK